MGAQVISRPTASISLRGALKIRDGGCRPGLWKAACALLVLPVGAIAHHALFYRPTCMLNPFGGEYDLQTVGLWLSRDPSLLFAILIALLVFKLGERLAALRWVVVSFLIAFMPLALWIWDVPWSGRIICHGFHDGRVLLAEGIPLKSRHFYVLGTVLQPILLTASLRLSGLRLPAPRAMRNMRRILATGLAFRLNR